MFIERGMDKEVVFIYIYIYIHIYIYIYTHIYIYEYYSAIKVKNKTMPLAATWMELEIIMVSEVNQTEKGKYHMMSLTCGI